MKSLVPKRTSKATVRDIKSKPSNPVGLRRIKKLHFVGVGGAGMCGIAEVLLSSGYTITGSDLKLSEATDRLVRLGAVIQEGHRAEYVADAQVVVISSAIREDNPEVQYAKLRNIPVIRRAEMLGELMRMKFGIAIAGTHGKTTTTSMIGEVLTVAGFDPTVVVGGRVVNLQTNAQVGQSDYLVVEADEFDRSFLRLTPNLAVVTTLDADHLDTYHNLDEIKAAFVEFVNKVPFYGAVVICGDEANLRAIRPQISRPLIVYGVDPEADFTIRDCQFQGKNSRFVAWHGSQELGVISLQVPGLHNVKNALATVAVGLELDIPWSKIKSGLEQFRGVHRRFEILGVYNDIMIVDDYAHHPTEIVATLSAAHQGYPQRRIVAIFQPHLYTRTRDLFNEFGTALLNASLAVVLDIYPSREEPIEGISGELVVTAARKAGHSAIHYVPDKKQVAGYVTGLLRPGDLVITLGAGDVYRVGLELVSHFRTGLKTVI